MYLNSDCPIQDPCDDKLGYSSFAKHLSESIIKMKSPKGLVISVYGKWGSGKTTVLNYVKYYLAQFNNENTPFIMDFNPWWFSGTDNILYSFFSQLKKHFENKWKNRLIHIGFKVNKITKIFGNDLSSLIQNDLVDLNKHLRDKISEINQKILVFIDDVDRLSPSEIKTLFQVIKAIADFPNVIFILAIDKEVVEKAIEDSATYLSGTEYLEKMIQVPFELPKVDITRIRNFLFEKLTEITSDSKEELFNKGQWNEYFFKGIDKYIRTPRDVVRYCNSIQITYPLVQDEVSLSDYFALECIRVFEHEVYDLLKKSVVFLAGSSDKSEFEEEIDKIWKHILLIKNKNDNPDIVNVKIRDEIEPLKELLSLMFPRVDKKLKSGIVHGYEWLKRWYRERRICHPEIAPIFFRLSLIESDFSHKELSEVLTKTGNKEEFKNFLYKFVDIKLENNKTKLLKFIQILENYTDIIQKKKIERFVKILFEYGDNLIKLDNSELHAFEFGLETHIGRVIWQFFKRLTNPEIYDILENVFSNSNSFRLMTNELISLGQQWGLRGARDKSIAEERFVTLNQYRTLERIFKKRIEIQKEDGTLFDNPSLLYILNQWYQSDSDEAKSWLQSVLDSNDLNVVKFVSKFKSSEFRIVGINEQKITRISYEELDKYTGTEQIKIKLMKIREERNNLYDEYKDVIDLFLDNIGKNSPDDYY